LALWGGYRPHSWGIALRGGLFGTSLIGELGPLGRPIANLDSLDLYAIYASLEYFLPYPFIPQTVVVSLTHGLGALKNLLI